MIEVNNLTVKQGGKNLISDFNTQFKACEFWAILGKNGTGKTTLLHALAGLQKFQAGNILIDGYDINSLSPLERAQKIALLSQLMETGLNCTVEQAVSYGRYPWHQTCKDTDTEKHIIDTAINDMGLNDLRNKTVQQISGGEMRKVEIATILAQDSDVLLLDEPLNHLDLAFRYTLMKQLKQLSDKKLIIMVTHDIQYVKDYCSNVLLLLNNGETINGKTKDTLNKNNINKMLDINLPDNVFV